MVEAGVRVRAARDGYLAENGFTVAEYDAPRTPASFLFWDFSVPNTPRHRWAIRLHDLHHVATGYGTDLMGEGEVSAWELGAGLSGLDLYVGSFILAGAVMGCLMSPRRAFCAWRRGRAATALWSMKEQQTDRERAYEELLSRTVDELSARIGVSPEVIQRQRGLHKNAPGTRRARAESTEPVSA